MNLKIKQEKFEFKDLKDLHCKFLINFFKILIYIDIYN